MGGRVRYDERPPMTYTYSRRFVLLVLASLLTCISACTRSVDTSVAKAKQHVSMLVGVTVADVEELQKGLPEGAEHLRSLYQSNASAKDDLGEVRKQLDRARNQVQDLRIAKSTFFALVDRDGLVLRSDREPDLMAGKSLFDRFPDVRQVLNANTVVSRGSMPEAAGLKGRPDGQYVLAVPVSKEQQVVGVYVSGWSWSAYAYRLQNALSGAIRDDKTNERAKEPLVYVYLVVDESVFGAPTAPEVNAIAIQKQSALTKIKGEEVLSMPLEVTGRDFGLAVQLAPSLGPNVAVAVLRSET